MHAQPFVTAIASVLLTACVATAEALRLPYPIVDTAQTRCYDTRGEIPPPGPAQPFFGQDAQYLGNQPRYRDNGDGTVADLVTGLIWQKDPGQKKTFRQAADGAARCRLAGHHDWRLPNAKELHSIVDYTRSPDTTRSAAIAPVFKCSQIKNEAGRPDYPCYWTSTTHAGTRGGQNAVYIAFGRALGWMPDRRTGRYQLLNVHGAGAQRSDPKTGRPDRFPRGRGPQGDAVRIYNHARCVRGGATPRTQPATEPQP